MASTRPVIVVTGGSRGIGAAAVRALAGNGYDVALGYRQDAGAAERVVAEATAAGARCVAVQADVSREEDVERLFASAARHGPVAGLVSNAGMTGHIGDLADTPVEIIRRVIDVNLVGAVLCARAAARMMSTGRGGAGGAIVHISSAAATLGSAHEYVHYAAAKAGIETLTVGLAKELAGEGVRVNAVAPGIVDTEIHAEAGQPDRARTAAARIPLGRAAAAEEITPAILWLLSPAAAYTTGAVIRVAGGL
jgi:NAD(P)-dependent dehydrogenase (short-subunit alcohol dehydrogenase family)